MFDLFDHLLVPYIMLVNIDQKRSDPNFLNRKFIKLLFPAKKLVVMGGNFSFLQKGVDLKLQIAIANTLLIQRV